MAVIPLQLPAIAPNQSPGGNIETDALPIASDQTVYAGDVLILTDGTVESAATNPSSALIGLADHASGAVYAGGAPDSTVSKYDTPFGAFTSGFNETDVTNMHFVRFNTEVEVIFSLNTSEDLAQTLVGSEVGIVKDSTTGIYYVSTAGSNKVAVITGILQPSALGYGVIGTDTGGRVTVRFIESALVY